MRQRLQRNCAERSCRLPRRQRRPMSNSTADGFRLTAFSLDPESCAAARHAKPIPSMADADGAFAYAHRIGCINDGREYHPRTELLRMRTESGACIIARPEQRLHRPLAELARPSAKPQFRGNSSMRILAGPRRAAQMRVAGKGAHPATRPPAARRTRHRPPIAA